MVSVHFKPAKMCLLPENIRVLTPQMPDFMLLSQGVRPLSPGTELLLWSMNGNSCPPT